MSALDGLLVYVPQLDPDGWEKAIGEAPDEERALIRRQMQLNEILARFTGAVASPEVMGVLSLWSRCFGLCDAARGAITRQSRLGLGFLERPAFELALHVQVIFEVPQTDERLCAYVAWCLDADRRYWVAISQDDHLQRAYDQQPARDQARALRSVDPELAPMFGEVEELSDQEAEVDRDTARRQAIRQVDLIDAWLRDERLAPWISEIAAIKRKHNKKYGVEFYSLFNESEGSVYQRLNKADSKHAYLAFSRGSAVLHGSSLEASLRLDSIGVAPLIGCSKREMAAGIEAVHIWIEWVALMLWLKAKPTELRKES